MRIVFVQLPLIDHGFNYIAGNIPNASATLHAFCAINFPSTIRAHQIDPYIQNFGSDTVIINSIIQLQPTHVAFTCYLWNVERSLAIAKKIKALSPDIIILFGGPEVQLNSFILTTQHTSIDYFVIGEGEFFFIHYCNNTHVQFLQSVNGNSVFIQPAHRFIPLQQMVEPYTTGYLQPMFDNSISVEIIRGCPFKCNYCLYSKNTHRVRAFPPETLSAIVQKARKAAIEEIYLLAPTFNQSSRFNDYIEALIHHKNSVPLHTELRADTITRDIALKLKKANFHSFEVGLQTLNQDCLRKIGRKTNPMRELDGIKYLKDLALTLQIGIIPGLPYDTPQSFFHTIDTLLNQGLGNEVELYPLMVLPGTELYDLAIAHKATFMEKPPYYFIEGFNFTNNDLQAITQYFEETTGFTFNPPYVPSFVMKNEGFLNGAAYININKHQSIPDSVFGAIETNHFIFFLAGDSSKTLEIAIETILEKFCSDTMLCSIVLINNHIFGDRAIGTKLLEKTKDTFHYRMMHFNDEYDRLPVRIFQLFDALTPFLKATNHYRCINPILKITHRNLDVVVQKIFAYPFPVVIEKGLVSECLQWLQEKYNESYELVSFEDEADQKIFYDSLSITYKQILPLKTLFI